MSTIPFTNDMAKIKCIFLDLDGTLFNDKKEITDFTMTRLKEIEKLGVKLVIATGRPTQSLPALPADLAISCFLTCNGAAISDNGATIYHQTINHDSLMTVMERLGSDDYFLQYYIDGEIYITRRDWEHLNDYDNNEHSRRRLLYESHVHEDLHQELKAGKFSCEKVNVLFAYPYTEEKACGVKRLLSDIGDLKIVEGGFTNIEITDCRVSKATAVAFLLNRLGLTHEEAMAFGDSENDFDLLKAVKYGIAMENAAPALKEIAWGITKSNEEDGVAYVLDKLITLMTAAR